MGKGSARTLKHWLDLGYSDTDAEKMRLSRTPGTFEYFNIFKKLGVAESKQARIDFQANRAVTLKNMIRKYGDVEGNIKWDIYKQKQAHTNSFEYKQERYGWDIEKYEAYNKKRGRAGEENQNFGSSYYERWVEKYGKDKADEMNDTLTTKKRNFGTANGNFGRDFTVVHRERMSKSAIARVVRQGTYTSYNKSSIPIIEAYGSENGYEFKHAENGGEYHVPNTMFMVDGYDIENNVVIEFDEVHHKLEKNIIKDKQRQDQIGFELKCKFIRMNESLEVRIFDYSN